MPIKTIDRHLRMSSNEDTALTHAADILSGGNVSALFRKLLIEKLRTMQATSQRPVLPMLIEHDDDAAMNWLAGWAQAYRGDEGWCFEPSEYQGKTVYTPRFYDPAQPNGFYARAKAAGKTIGEFMFNCPPAGYVAKS